LKETNTENINIDAYDYFLIVDLESTCCDLNSIPNGEHEIIEIGAVMVESNGLKQVDAFNTFIRPCRHTSLTKFCIELTSIEQQNVDSAPSYVDAIGLFQTWLAQYENYLFCSWGNYDRNHLASDSVYHNVQNPISAPHLNIKKSFAKKQKTRAMGMQFALQLVGEPLSGNHHRGIDDATNMVKLLPFALGRKGLTYLSG
jgi:inhibitor of KinA sporulation pathway (predicted exonuclease)